jgi:hypothetical protein
MGEAARAFAVGRDWSREIDVLIEQYEDVRRRDAAAHDPSELRLAGVNVG